MRLVTFLRAAIVSFALMCSGVLPLAQAARSPASASSPKTRIVLDTDIGDDIDDAFALALALRSPEIEILGTTTAWGDTQLRARLMQRFLRENGADKIPLAAGIPTK